MATSANQGNIGLVLLSGGLDSTVALWWAMGEGYRTLTSLCFQYGSKEEIVSLQCSKRIADKAGIKNCVLGLEFLHKITEDHSALVGASGQIPEGLDGSERLATRAVWVPARNLVMISVAASFAETLGGDVDIVVGFDAEEARTFPDNSKRFVNSINHALKDAVFEKNVKVVAPLIDLGKKEIVDWSVKLGAPVELSCSCYQPRGFVGDKPKHCGICQSCILRHKGFESAGLLDPTIYEVEPA